MKRAVFLLVSALAACHDSSAPTTNNPPTVPAPPVVKEVPSDKPAGIVVDQNPAGGTSRALGSPVEIDVSNGKTPVSPHAR